MRRFLALLLSVAMLLQVWPVAAEENNSAALPSETAAVECVVTPTPAPTAEPTAMPTAEPTAEPASTPTAEPTSGPVATCTPTAMPSVWVETTKIPTQEWKSGENIDDSTTEMPNSGNTQTPSPTVTPFSLPTERPAPTAEPIDGPEATPTPTAMAENVQENTPSPTLIATATPDCTNTPTQQENIGEESDASPTPTAETDEQATPFPTAQIEATMMPEATPESDAAWDEALCDHANFRCAQAPACETAGCEHIRLDVNRLPVPLCPLGRWVLDRQDALAREGRASITTKSVRRQEINLDLGNAVIYRSGTYTVTGGWNHEAKLTIMDGRVVNLRVKDCAMDTLVLRNGSRTNVTLYEQNAVVLLQMMEDTQLTWTEGGSVLIRQVIRPQDDKGEKSRFSVYGASVRCQTDEFAGRKLNVFRAKGMTSCLVEGKPYPANTADENGECCLWLPSAGAGCYWDGVMEGDVLKVRRETLLVPVATDENKNPEQNEGDSQSAESTPKPEGESKDDAPKGEGDSQSAESTPKPEGESKDDASTGEGNSQSAESTPKPEGESKDDASTGEGDSQSVENTPKPEGESKDDASTGEGDSQSAESTPKPDGESKDDASTGEGNSQSAESTPKPEGESKDDVPTGEGDSQSAESTPKPEGESTPAPESKGDIRMGLTNTITSAGQYVLKGHIAPQTSIRIECDGVTVVLDHVSAEFVEPLIDSDYPATVMLAGESVLAGSMKAGKGNIKLCGAGSLKAADVGTAVEILSGTIRVQTLPDGYEPVTEAGGIERVQVDGRMVPLVICGGMVCLKQAPAGMEYVLHLTDAVLECAQRASGPMRFTVAEGDEVRIQGEFEALGCGKTVPGLWQLEKSAAGHVQNVRLFGNPAIKSQGASVTFHGDNVLQSQDNAVSGEMQITVADGRLLMNQQDPSGLTLWGNIMVTGSCAPCAIRVTDEFGNPVGNTALQVKMGEEVLNLITFNDGTLSLYGIVVPDGTAVVASDTEKIYTGVMMNGHAEVTDHMNISPVEFSQDEKGQVTLTFRADRAQTMGIQYRLDGGELADRYEAEAMRESASGTLKLTGLNTGTTIVAQAYATLGENVPLNEKTQDGFMFGPVCAYTVQKHYQPQGDANATYTGRAYRNPLDLPKGAQVWYTGDDLVNGMPVHVGEYTMHILIPQGQTDYVAEEIRVAFEIKPIELIIVPDPNQQKYEGMEDPELTYTTRNLREGDEVRGLLTREAGEEPGNYAFRVDRIIAPDYYTIRLVNRASEFTILPMEMPVVFYEMLHPIHQDIVKADGRKVSVLWKHQENLTITYSRIGRTVYGAQDERVRTVSPSLAYNAQQDQVLLRLRTEAQLNADGGYKTDMRGNKNWTGRFFRLSWTGLRSMHNLGIDAISLQVNGCSVMLPLSPLMTEEGQKMIAGEGVPLKQAVIRVYVEPVELQPAPDALRPVLGAWRAQVTVEKKQSGVRKDITHLVPGISLQMDMEDVAEGLTALNRYEDDAFQSGYTIYRVDGDTARPMDAEMMLPWSKREQERTGYPTMMYTHRYLHVPLKHSGVYTVAAKGV